MKISEKPLQHLPVVGMHCASCATLIQKHLRESGGFADATVSYTTEKLALSAETEQLAKVKTLVKELGYEVVLPQTTNTSLDANTESGISEENSWESVLPLSVLVFGFMVYELVAAQLWWLPPIPLPMNVVQFAWWVAASFVLWQPGQRFMQALARFIKRRQANMDTLIGLGTLVAYSYSSFSLFFSRTLERLKLPIESYFDVVIVVIGFVLFGKYLEGKMKHQTGGTLRALAALQAKSAMVKQGNEWVATSIDQVVPGSVIRVKSGEKVPLDGVIVHGESSIDESLLTGESLPVVKQVKDSVLGGSVVLEGYIDISVTADSQAGFLSQVMSLVETAENSKAPIERIADRVSEWFVWVVLLIALGSAAGWLVAGWYGESSLVAPAIRALVGVLVIACPCALGLATPAAMVVAMGKAASRGILIKSAATLEALSKAQVVVLDKTGTLTIGKPKVTSYSLVSKQHPAAFIWGVVVGLEAGSTHPLAQALVAKAKALKHLALKVTQVKSLVGAGVSGAVNGELYWLGGQQLAVVQQASIQSWQDQPGTQVFLGKKDQILAVFSLSDELKPTAVAAVSDLKNMGLEVALLTGDRTAVATTVAQQVGITTVLSQVQPADKLAFIKSQQQLGKQVVMVGDGVNDAPALTQATVGIAMSNGSDSAISSAGISVLRGDLQKVVAAFRLSRKTLAIVRQNLWWAFGYNALGIPLAAGWLAALGGWWLPPAYAGIAMALSSISVVANSLRLRAWRG